MVKYKSLVIFIFQFPGLLLQLLLHLPFLFFSMLNNFQQFLISIRNNVLRDEFQLLLLLLFLFQFHLLFILDIIYLSLIFWLCNLLLFLSFSLLLFHPSKFFLSFWYIPLFCCLLIQLKWGKVSRQLLYIMPVFLHLHQLIYIDTIINPLRLHILFCLDNFDIRGFSIRDDMSNCLVLRIKLIGNSASHGQYCILE